MVSYVQFHSNLPEPEPEPEVQIIAVEMAYGNTYLY